MAARIAVVVLELLLLTAAPPLPGRVEVLRASSAIPVHIAGAFLEPLAFQQADDGRYFIFDRRGHAVYTIANDEANKIVEIGFEPGKILDPSAFDLDPASGFFVVADAPNRVERIQTFSAAGAQVWAFILPGRAETRLTLGNIVMNGIGSLQFTGNTLLLNQPERGALITEMDTRGNPFRTFGNLRPTGHEDDRNLHLALNVGLPLADPTGGYYFVFQAGVPVFRKYDASGTLVFERHVEGPELDQTLQNMPDTWPRRNGELPIVPPTVRTAAVDRQGRLWVSLVQPFTYVYDRQGEKIRTLQFRGADILAPNSLFFTKDGRILVTPGLYEFRVP